MLTPLLTETAKRASTLFTQEERSLLDPQHVPHHIAIIMDGNRRWAQNEKLKAVAGYWEGAELLIEIVRASAELGVRVLTVYAFSTENWFRPENEIEGVMELFEFYLTHKRELMVQEGIRLDVIGDITKLPSKVQAALQETRSATASGTQINLVLALNYGGRDEIRRAMLKIIERHEREPIKKEELTETFISQFLDTSRWKDPDLMIRTGGDMRISNFLLWQLSYSELYISDKFWPDFTPKELLRALLDFQSRRRNFGK